MTTGWWVGTWLILVNHKYIVKYGNTWLIYGFS
jgi:hypothetical protein